jgi:glycosyltransferase involved in cell wall biosynthesis
VEGGPDDVKSATFVVPGPLTTRTGGSIYDRRVVEGLRARGWHVTVVELDAFAHPLAPPLATAPARFAAIPDHELVLVDGLAFGTMPEVIERESWRLRFVPIVHMVLSATPGLTRGESAWLSNLERRALARAHHILITGTRTKRFVTLMTGRNTDDQITCIPPGIDRAVTRTLRSDGPVRLLCVANVTWGKGHDVLLEALSRQHDAEWELTCVGSVTRDTRYAERLSVRAAQLGLQRRIRWLGELDTDAIEAQFAGADLFVLPTRAETYGMAVAEAIAHGLPVVSTRTGEIASIAGEGGLLAEPGDVDGFAFALKDAICDPTLRGQLADGARTAATRLPTWSDTADAMETVLNRFVGPAPPKPEGRIVPAPPKPEGRRRD